MQQESKISLFEKFLILTAVIFAVLIAGTMFCRAPGCFNQPYENSIYCSRHLCGIFDEKLKGYPPGEWIYGGGKCMNRTKEGTVKRSNGNVVTYAYCDYHTCSEEGCDFPRIPGSKLCSIHDPVRHAKDMAQWERERKEAERKKATEEAENKKKKDEDSRKKLKGNSTKNNKSASASTKYDPYDVWDYDDPDDFADEWADEFEDYDDAFDYWEDAHGR